MVLPLSAVSGPAWAEAFRTELKTVTDSPPILTWSQLVPQTHGSELDCVPGHKKEKSAQLLCYHLPSCVILLRNKRPCPLPVILPVLKQPHMVMCHFQDPTSGN